MKRKTLPPKDKITITDKALLRVIAEEQAKAGEKLPTRTVARLISEWLAVRDMRVKLD